MRFTPLLLFLRLVAAAPAITDTTVSLPLATEVCFATTTCIPNSLASSTTGSLATSDGEVTETSSVATTSSDPTITESISTSSVVETETSSGETFTVVEPATSSLTATNFFNFTTTESSSTVEVTSTSTAENESSTTEFSTSAGETDSMTASDSITITEPSTSSTVEETGSSTLSDPLSTTESTMTSNSTAASDSTVATGTSTATESIATTESTSTIDSTTTSDSSSDSVSATETGFSTTATESIATTESTSTVDSTTTSDSSSDSVSATETGFSTTATPSDSTLTTSGFFTSTTTSFNFQNTTTSTTTLASATTSSTAVPSGIQIERVTYGGSGCSSGTVASQLSADKSTLTLLYGDFIAQAGPGLRPTDARKNCQLNVAVTYPGGWQYSVMKADYRGYAYLGYGQQGVLRAAYYFSGQSQQIERTTNLTGPIDTNYLKTDQIDVESTVWSPCGYEGLLNINTEVRIAPLVSENPALMTFDSADLKFTQVHYLVWQECEM